MRKNFCVNWIVTATFLLLGIALRFVPGVRFSSMLCFALAGLSLVWMGLGIWAKRGKAGRWCRRIFAAGCCAVLVLLGTLEANVILTARRDMSMIPADAVIILGAGVNGTTPSLTLRTRLEAALDYLEAHPDVPVVLSGGQGPGEAVTEARCMADWLTARGVEPERLLLEEDSTSTAENFAYSKVCLEAAGIDPDTARIAFITNDFHVYRAGYLASQAGYEQTFGIPAELPWRYLEVNYYLRESFALVKTLIFD